jgi:hypothetical protein
MQTEAAVERQRSIVRPRTPDRDGRPSVVIGRLGAGYDNIQAVDGAAQEDYDQPLGPTLGRRRPCSAAQRQQRRPRRYS